MKWYSAHSQGKQLQIPTAFGQKDLYSTPKWFVRLKLPMNIHMDTIRQQQMPYTIGDSVVFPNSKAATSRVPGEWRGVETG